MTEKTSEQSIVERLVQLGAILAALAGILLFIGYVALSAQSRVLGIDFSENDAAALTSSGGLAVLRTLQIFLLPIARPFEFIGESSALWSIDPLLVWVFWILIAATVFTGIFLSRPNLLSIWRSKIAGVMAATLTAIAAILVFLQQSSLENAKALNYPLTPDQRAYVSLLDPSKLSEKLELAEILNSIVESAEGQNSDQKFGLGSDSQLRYIRYWYLLASSLLVWISAILWIRSGILNTMFSLVLLGTSGLTIAFLPLCYGVYASSFEFAVGDAIVKGSNNSDLKLSSVFLLDQTNDHLTVYSRIQGFRTYIIPKSEFIRFEQHYRDTVFSNCATKYDPYTFLPCEL